MTTVERGYFMRKIVSLWMIGCMLLTLTACGGNVSNVEVDEWQPSEIYSDEDIQSAITVVKDYFKSGFEGCTLTHINYPGDDCATEFEEWAEQYNADEAIVLYSSFDVGPNGGDGSLNPNSTYNNWKWVLVRNENSVWELKTNGYG